LSGRWGQPSFTHPHARAHEYMRISSVSSKERVPTRNMLRRKSEHRSSHLYMRTRTWLVSGILCVIGAPWLLAVSVAASCSLPNDEGRAGPAKSPVLLRPAVSPPRLSLADGSCHEADAIFDSDQPRTAAAAASAASAAKQQPPGGSGKSFHQNFMAPLGPASV
jgi:hypothetical protein